MSEDRRPLAAAGHLFLRASDVERAAKRLISVGVRAILVRETLAVMELRGGTHVVVRPLEDDTAHEAGFDLMYEDLDGARDLFAEAGFEVGPIAKGNVHRGFEATAPERFSIKVNDSHAGRRAV